MTNFIADPNLRTLLQVDTLLILGLMSMSNYTSVLRVTRKVFANPEDYVQKRLALPDPSSASSAEADSVARSRRMHLNHLENVLPFLVLSLLYALTQPGHTLFAGLLWSFLIARVLYTGSYALGLQPHRMLAYAAGLVLQHVIAILTLVATLAS
jgi:glutathione S-transferase